MSIRVSVTFPGEYFTLYPGQVFRALEGGKVVSLRIGRFYPLGETTGIHFY